MELQSENEFMYHICTHISCPLKDLKMHYVSQKLYRDMFDEIIYRYLILEEVMINYHVHKYETTRKKAIHVELYKLKNKNKKIYKKIMNKLTGLFEYFDTHDKYFDYYIQLYFEKFLSYTKKYIDYDNSCLNELFLDIHIDEKTKIIYFLRNNIMLFIDYCFTIEKYDYISILIYDLYNIGFDIDLNTEQVRINQIFDQMKTIFDGTDLNTISYNCELNEIIEFIHNLFWLNSQLFMDKSFYDDKIKIYQIYKLKEIRESNEYKSCKSNKLKKRIIDKIKTTPICPCCLHKYLKIE